MLQKIRTTRHVTEHPFVTLAPEFEEVRLGDQDILDLATVETVGKHAEGIAQEGSTTR